ncbi:MAG: sensor histidine kinase [Flavobacterium sp. BFFFF1]|uniref:sensor histidine kinase n=1 Tax=Flavobacterium sp. BFFFF1 TaxID=2015557 RepID=UPI000BCF8268|nr:sensor histidine kinase [Flavobacterium sp. BFFFF1]OYU81367.1 MAG: sensor histidine kinase [Flavobacterium sp. BFFFF1]
MKKSLSVYAFHICVCAAFILLPYVFSSTGTFLTLPDLNNGHDRTYFGIYISLLIFFYINYFLLIPRLYFHDKRFLYVVIIVLTLLFFLWVSNFLDRRFAEVFETSSVVRGREHWVPSQKFSPARLQDKPVQDEHTILIYIVGVLSSLFFSINKRLQLTEKEKLAAELSLLKAQINPHFLFNTLNSIYSLAIRKDDRTADSIVKLSELMRYIMTNAHDNLIDLRKEIEYISNYVSLQQSRLEDTVRINYMFCGNPIGKKITPLILISFIENAFKHGVNPEENSEIDILIDVEGEELKLFVYNRKVHSVHAESGIGMKNTIERLELLYPERYELSVKDLEESFSVTLTLIL